MYGSEENVNQLLIFVIIISFTFHFIHGLIAAEIFVLIVEDVIRYLVPFN